MKKIIVVMVSTLLLMSSCGTYTKYTRPDIQVANTYTVPDSVETDTSSWAGITFDAFFTDIHLQQLIREGLEKNTNLRQAWLKVGENVALLRSARKAFLPSISIGTEGGVQSFDHHTTKSYQIGPSASWEIETFGRLSNSKWMAESALEGSRQYAQAVQTQLIASIAQSYYTLLMLDEQLRIQQQAKKLWTEQIDAYQQMVEAGMTTEASVLQATANCQQLEADILSTKKAIAATENGLCNLLGKPSCRIERGVLSQQTFPQHLSTGIPVQLLANRPDVRQAEYALQQAYYGTGIARSAFYPSLTLSGTLGWTNYQGTVNPAKILANALASLTQPVFNKGRIKANYEVAKLQQESALLAFQQKLTEAGNEVNDAMKSWQTADQRIKVNEAQVATLKAAVDKTKLLMEHSSTTYLEVLTAQQSLLSAQLSLVNDKAERIQSVITLYHALGGGK